MLYHSSIKVSPMMGCFPYTLIKMKEKHHLQPLLLVPWVTGIQSSKIDILYYVFEQFFFSSEFLLPFISSFYQTTLNFSLVPFNSKIHCSFYEYLLKVWIHGNKTAAVKHYRYEAISSIILTAQRFFLMKKI